MRDTTAQRFTVRARLSSVRCATKGFVRFVRREHNAWLHLVATVVVASAGLAMRLGPSDWRWLVLAAGIVWMAEAVNSAIEILCDRIHPGHDPAIGLVKDIAAAAVLIAAIAAALIGGLTFLPYLPEWCP